MSAYDKQIGGKHYQNFSIQPSKFVIENELLFPEGSVIKYICRHRFKNGKEDLEKAVHFIEMIIERDYPTIPMTEEEEYRNAGITKEKAERTYPPKNSWGMTKPPETSNADWIKGYKEWKKGDCPHN
tara:strand:- start:624 stop:1004 length:381 start_codon:yes stop_codon:yes gene_type:complete